MYERGAVDAINAFHVPPGQRPEAVRAAEGLADMPVLRGNKVQLLIDGDATFDSIFQGIDSAKAYVLVQSYIVRDDGLGHALKDRLVAKAKEGVRVYFLYDEVGSHALPGNYLDELRSAGVEASALIPVKEEATVSSSIFITTARLSWSMESMPGSAATMSAMNTSAKILISVIGATRIC